MRFKNIEHYVAYIRDIGKAYDADDTIFTGFVYILKAPELLEVNRSECGR